MNTLLYCPRCGSDRLARLAKNDVTPFRGYRCERCGRRLRDRGSLVAYLFLVAAGLFLAWVLGTSLEWDGLWPTLGRLAVLGGIPLPVVVYAVVGAFRPTPRTSPPGTPAPGGDWYFARHGGKVGPFTFDQMRRMAASGALAAADMVLDPRSGTWGSAGTAAGLFATDPAPTAPVASPPSSATSAANPVPGRRRAGTGRVVVLVVAVVGVGLVVWPGTRNGGDDGREQVRVEAPVAPPTPPIDTRMEVLTLAPGREVQYRAGCRTEAERLGRALAEAGFTENTWPAPVRLDRAGDTWLIEWSLKTAAYDDPKTVPATERWVVIPVAAKTVPGGRVEVRLRDAEERERAVIRIAGAHRSPALMSDKAAVYSRDGAKGEADGLAALLGRLRLDGRVAWVILLDRQAGVWVVTPLNVVPKELTPETRRRWAGLAEAAGRELAAPVRVEILDELYRPAVLLTPADAGG